MDLLYINQTEGRGITSPTLTTKNFGSLYSHLFICLCGQCSETISSRKINDFIVEIQGRPVPFLSGSPSMCTEQTGNWTKPVPWAGIHGGGGFPWAWAEGMESPSVRHQNADGSPACLVILSLPFFFSFSWFCKDDWNIQRFFKKSSKQLIERLNLSQMA